MLSSFPPISLFEKQTVVGGVTANHHSAFPPRPTKELITIGYSTARDDLTPQDYLAFAQQWKALGATIIGGCCGIGPEHIALLDALKD